MILRCLHIRNIPAERIGKLARFSHISTLQTHVCGGEVGSLLLIERSCFSIVCVYTIIDDHTYIASILLQYVSYIVYRYCCSTVYSFTCNYLVYASFSAQVHIRQALQPLSSIWCQPLQIPHRSLDWKHWASLRIFRYLAAKDACETWSSWHLMLALVIMGV